MALVAEIRDEIDASRAGEPLFRLSVAQYLDLVRQGFFAGQEDLELLDGFLIRKMSKNPLHSLCHRLLLRWLFQTIPPGYTVGADNPISLAESVPEPDAIVVRGSDAQFTDRNPTASETLIAIEISDSSLERDQSWKLGIYARAAIPHYWIVNIPARRLELYSQPLNGAYQQTQFLTAQESAEVTLDSFSLTVTPGLFLGPSA